MADVDADADAGSICSHRAGALVDMARRLEREFGLLHASMLGSAGTIAALIFDTAALGTRERALVLPLLLVPSVAGELTKAMVRQRRPIRAEAVA